jgi:predicted phosphohydrolase
MPRIVAVADTHGFHENLVIPLGDIFIHAGDLTQRGTLVQLKQVADWMRALPHANKIVIAGNHDFALEQTPAAARELFHGLTYLEDEMTQVMGLKIYGTPWQPWFYDWAFNVKRGAPIAEKWKLIPYGVDVLVTHGPPFGYGDMTHRGERVGCEELIKCIEEKRPQVNIFGHIHEDKGQWGFHGTRLINVTTSECELEATVFDVK